MNENEIPKENIPTEEAGTVEAPAMVSEPVAEPSPEIIAEPAAPCAAENCVAGTTVADAEPTVCCATESSIIGDAANDVESVAEEVAESNVAEPAASTNTSSRSSGISTDSIKDAIKCMISFFTIIRIDVGEKEYNAMEKNFWLAPALGFLNGLVAFIAVAIVTLCGLGTLAQATVAVVSMFVFSKFLHFDGLTDFGDGIIVSSGNREDHVRALKDSVIGAGGFGVALCVVLLSVVLYNQMGGISTYIKVGSMFVPMGIAMVAFSVEILVKNAQVAAAAFGEPGTGMASRQVSNTDQQSLIRSTVLTVILLAITTAIGIGVAKLGKIPNIDWASVALLFIVAVMASIGIGYLMAKKANKTFGFVNGDILGATNEIARAGILLISALMVGLFW